MEEQHVCDSKYTVVVVVCSAAEEVVGNYFVLWGQGNVTEGSGVSFKLTASSALSTSSGAFDTYIIVTSRFATDALPTVEPLH